MMTFMLIHMAFRSISHHIVRSALTLLGIVIGIAGIIAISAVGKGTEKRARDQFLTYGSKTINIWSGNFLSQNTKPPKKLSIHDVETIKAQCPAVQHISSCAYTRQIMLEYGGKIITGEVAGIEESMQYIDQDRILKGRCFIKEEMVRTENVVLLNPEAAASLFKNEDPMNKVIRVNKHSFTVIGLLAPRKIKGKWDFGIPQVIIPFSTHKKYFPTAVQTISLSTYTQEQVAEVIRQLEKIFRAAHQLQEGESNDFVLHDNQTFAKAAEQASQSVGLFALIAAFIALLVGGIGVMNIMLVTVQERTQEIGIKMALGATAQLIRMQFLIESVVICFVGGTLGIIIGIGSVIGLNQWLNTQAILHLTPILTSFLCTVFIGVCFGLYPAEKAARLDPIKALTEY